LDNQTPASNTLSDRWWPCSEGVSECVLIDLTSQSHARICSGREIGHNPLYSLRLCNTHTNTHRTELNSQTRETAHTGRDWTTHTWWTATGWTVTDCSHDSNTNGWQTC